MAINLEIINSWDQLIQRGQGTQVRRALSLLKISQIPRELIADTANLARRVRASHLALTWLYPFIREEQSQIEKSTGKEVAEYAAALIDQGVLVEAEKLLKQINPIEYHRSQLYMAFLLFKKWDYANSIPYLKTFLELCEDEYFTQIGKLNLAAALINIGEFTQAERLLNSVMTLALKNNLTLLTGHCLELLAQINYHINDFKAAKSFLDQSQKHLQSSKSSGYLYALKWNAILTLNSDNEAGKKELDRVKRLALKQRDWETIRDCDRHISIICKDQIIFDKNYFGSPFKSYRESLENESELKPSQRYVLKSKRQPKFILSLHQGLFANAKIKMKPGQLVHRLVYNLASDQYKYFTTGNLFSHLFPNEHFNPLSSPERVYKAVQRFRAWSEKQSIPWQTIQSGGHYYLKLGAEVGIEIALAQLDKDIFQSKQFVFIQQAKQHWSKNTFSAKAASLKLNLPLRSVNRLIQESIDVGLIKKIGAGPKTKFKLVS